MTGVRAAGPAPAPDSERARLRTACAQLEGVFLAEITRIMRETVPDEGGILQGGAGEEIFTGLLDQHLTEQAAQRAERGIGAALYRRLVAHLPPEPGP